jgi:YjbR
VSDTAFTEEEARDTPCPFPQRDEIDQSERSEASLKPADFRRIALSLEGAEEGSHMGAADFRVGGRIFATLASQDQGYGNLMLTPEMQADFVNEAAEVFLPIRGGWGRMGMTHICLAKASEDVLAGALRAAWKLRVETNGRTRRSKAKKR